MGKKMLTKAEKEKLKALALRQVGKKYIFGVEVKMTDANPRAFDCSELIQWLYFQIGYIVPDGSFNQYEHSGQLKQKANSQGLMAATGDLVFCRRGNLRVGHVGVVIQGSGSSVQSVGNDEKKFFVIEARNSKVGVVKTTLDEFMGRKSFVGIRRPILNKRKNACLP